MTTLGIIGTGLIGGSIGMRAREFGWGVIGCDADSSAAEEAQRAGAVDQAVSRAEIDARADVIAIAAHTSGTIAELERMKTQPPRKAQLIVDISSVKAPIVAAARGVRNFVATHPMAGRERSGAAAATRDLFDGKTWLFVPSGNRELDWRAVEFIGAFGATPVEVDAETHDRTVAFTSHLPQVLGTVFARAASRNGTTAEAHYLGPAANELLRLSRSSPAMWHDILRANHENIARELRTLAGDLVAVADALDRGGNLFASALTP